MTAAPRRNPNEQRRPLAAPGITAAEVIRVRGARQNNLAGVDVDIPKRQLVAFTGVSGSGKSSLAFDTVAAESQRLINETYPAFLQSMMPALPRPDVDSIEHLNAAVVVDQDRLGANPRSSVATVTDCGALLRQLFARNGQPTVDGPAALSANDPAGACPRCAGTGRVSDLDLEVLLDRSRSLNDGALTFPNFAPDSLFWKVYAASGFFDNDKVVRDFSETELQQLLRGTGPKVDTGSYPMAYEGLLDKIDRLYLSKERDSLKPRIRDALDQAATTTDCPDCGGTRLNAIALECRIADRNVADCTREPVSALATWVSAGHLGDSAVAQALAATLQHLEVIGLGYLALDRPAGTLSGGESQRLKMVRHLGSSLTEMTYVLDEPTTGLHPADTARMLTLLQQLRDKGNTVLVVEHNPDVIASADHVIDLGPGAGTAGGTITYQGDVPGLLTSGTATGDHLRSRRTVKTNPRTPTGALPIRHARLNNLQDVSVDIPRGVLTVVTGVAGAGKSSLILGSLPRTDTVAVLDQAPIRGSRRSNPATYSGVFDSIRTAFAAANDVPASLFSFNAAGACPTCNGLGVVFSDLAYLAAAPTTCDTCHGRRFADEVLRHTLDGQSIADVLAMPIAAASQFFRTGSTLDGLSRLVDVGLGYLTLGQPLSTLSGGERQRLRLALEIRRHAETYVLDEPSAGLHPADVDNLIRILDRLVDDGATVVAIEHNRNVIARADHVIDLGPGAGIDGGRVLYEGPPAGLLEVKDSATGHHLRQQFTHRDTQGQDPA